LSDPSSSLTFLARFDIFVDIIIHSRPMVPAGDLFIGGLTAPVSQIIVESFYNFLLFRWLADYSSRGDPALLGSLVEVPVANEILMCILSKFPKLVIRKVGRSLHSLQILPDGQIFADIFACFEIDPCCRIRRCT